MINMIRSIPKMNWLLLLLLGASSNAMNIVNRMDIPGEIHLLETSWDRAIPLVLPFMIPYLLYFFFIFGTIGYLFICQPKIFRAFAWSMIVIGLITAVINIAFQSYAPRAVVEGNDIFSHLLRWHYGLNRPLTAYPSLHVSDSLCCAYFLWRVPVRQSWIWITFAVIVSISTVLVKEHYIADVVGGVIVSLMVSQFMHVFWAERQQRQPKVVQGS